MAKRKTATKKPQPTKSSRKPPARKPAAKRKPAQPSTSKMSALDAAAKVLGEAKQPLNSQELIERMAAKGYWTSPGGRTPSSTLYTAVTMLPKICCYLIS